MTLTIEVNLPADLARFRLPAALADRLLELLDRQESGQALTDRERAEAEGLTELAEFLTWLRLRTENAPGQPVPPAELSAAASRPGANGNARPRSDSPAADFLEPVRYEWTPADYEARQALKRYSEQTHADY